MDRQEFENTQRCVAAHRPSSGWIHTECIPHTVNTHTRSNTTHKHRSCTDTLCRQRPSSLHLISLQLVPEASSTLIYSTLTEERAGPSKLLIGQQRASWLNTGRINIWVNRRVLIWSAARFPDICMASHPPSWSLALQIIPLSFFFPLSPTPPLPCSPPTPSPSSLPVLIQAVSFEKKHSRLFHLLSEQTAPKHRGRQVPGPVTEHQCLWNISETERTRQRKGREEERLYQSSIFNHFSTQDTLYIQHFRYKQKITTTW